MKVKKTGHHIKTDLGRLEVLIRESEALQAAQYSNYQLVSHNRNEFSIYFLQIDPYTIDQVNGTIEAVLVSKVVIAPNTFAALQGAMGENLSRYAKAYGDTIEEEEQEEEQGNENE